MPRRSIALLNSLDLGKISNASGAQSELRCSPCSNGCRRSSRIIVPTTADYYERRDPAAPVVFLAHSTAIDRGEQEGGGTPKCWLPSGSNSIPAAGSHLRQEVCFAQWWVRPPGTLNMQWMLRPTGTRTGQASTLRVSAAPPYDPSAPAVPRSAVTLRQPATLRLARGRRFPRRRQGSDTLPAVCRPTVQFNPSSPPGPIGATRAEYFGQSKDAL